MFFKDYIFWKVEISLTQDVIAPIKKASAPRTPDERNRDIASTLFTVGDYKRCDCTWRDPNDWRPSKGGKRKRFTHRFRLRN